MQDGEELPVALDARSENVSIGPGSTGAAVAAAPATAISGRGPGRRVRDDIGEHDRRSDLLFPSPKVSYYD